jgi:hypothetical protein
MLALFVMLRSLLVASIMPLHNTLVVLNETRGIS